MLILECDGNASGCIAITHTEENVAQLRYFFLEPELRGLGVGTNLIKTALDFLPPEEIYSCFFVDGKRTGSSKKIIQKCRFQDNRNQ